MLPIYPDWHDPFFERKLAAIAVTSAVVAAGAAIIAIVSSYSMYKKPIIFHPFI